MPPAGVIDSHEADVRHWLGFSLYPPEGLHGPRRGKIVRRHTRLGGVAGGRRFGQALAASYPRNRELRLMHLLKRQRLDDDLWRQVYAVMVQGGPIVLDDLIRSVADLTDADPKIADAMAIALYQSWDRILSREAKANG